MSGFNKFEQAIQDANGMIGQIAQEMGDPRQQIAYHALRGVLFALRDRLRVDDALHLSSQLPLLIRGIYFEGYKAAGKPLKLDREDFLERVASELQAVGGANPEVATRAVFHVLGDHLSDGEMDHVRNSLPQDIRSLAAEKVSG